MTNDSDDTLDPTDSLLVRLVRKDFNKDKARLVIPKWFSRQLSKIRWSTVSKATERSRRMRTAARPASKIFKISPATHHGRGENWTEKDLEGQKKTDSPEAGTQLHVQ